MTCLVMRNGPLLLRSYDLRLSLKSSYDPVYGIKEVLLVNSVLVLSCSSKCRLVADIGDISSGESRSMLCKELEIEIICKLEVSQMHLEDFFPLLEVRKFHMNLAVETTCTHERLVKNICTVGSSKNYDSGVCTETVHLCKKLVQSVLTFIIRRKSAILASRTADCVDLVNEHDARSLLLCLSEKVTDT